MTVFNEAVDAARTYFGDSEITPKLVRKKRKTRRIVMVRNWVMAYMRARDPRRFSYPVIARIIGFSDHTTVIHGIRKAHTEYGEVLFRRLTLNRLQEQHKPLEVPQAIHISLTVENILNRGEQLLKAELATEFLNGKGWQRGAA